jgi:hypothetical protein
MDPAAIYSCMVGDSCTEEAIDHELADMGATPDVASTSAVMTRRCSSEHAAAKLRPARTDLLQLYFHVVRHFCPPASFRLSLGLPLDPLGVLAAGVEQLIREIRDSDDATAARADALLARARDDEAGPGRRSR